MDEIMEGIQISIIESCLKDIEGATKDLSQQLLEIGIPVEATSSDHWPRRGKVTYNIWNGVDHIDEPTGTKSNISLSADDMVSIAKRRQLLKRKF